MTGHAGRAGQVEVVVDVAVGALTGRHGMSAGERETRRAVIEVRIEPGIHTVAEGAVGGEAAGDVVRSGCSFKVRRVTGVAVCRHRLELAGGASLVTGVAIYGGVRAHQRKTIVVLLYLASGDLPSANGVALLAVCS